MLTFVNVVFMFIPNFKLNFNKQIIVNVLDNCKQLFLLIYQNMLFHALMFFLHSSSKSYFSDASSIYSSTYCAYST